ncbi:toxin-antitoxin system HicB family antitoxin [Nocardiopsis potens]|uniref:toxin-antitoxin system HicB family antitoxin n=1 Tax=Nocardiopsis potens TaxID=1246458 RepID=UPI0004763A38|nr:toxin-antitoxin system HicB family antitoxin [Nocardiopsis potens]
MDLMPYVDELRRQLLAAAEAGDEETRVIAERLGTALEPASRLALLDALSAAADEITRDLAPGSVEVRLRGRQTDFIVTSPDFGDAPDDGIATPPPPPEEAAPRPEAEEGGTSRITLRLPDRLKPRVEEAARAEGLSVNAWLVRAVSGAVEGGRRRPEPRTHQVGRGYTGWVR